jgi:hypothetical protein
LLQPLLVQRSASDGTGSPTLPLFACRSFTIPLSHQIVPAASADENSAVIKNAARKTNREIGGMGPPIAEKLQTLSGLEFPFDPYSEDQEGLNCFAG